MSGTMQESSPAPAGAPRPRAIRPPWFLLCVALLWLAGAWHQYATLTHIPASGEVAALRGFDDNCYFAFGRSLVLDGDWDFSNEYAFLAATQPESTAANFRELLASREGAPPNLYAPGTGLAAAPFIAAARGMDLLRARVGRTPPASPFAPLYPFAYLLAGITYGCLALVATRALVRRWLGPDAATVAAWAAVLCGPPVFYIVYAPGMSHATSAFLVASTLLAWTRWRTAPAGRAALGWALATGLCAGFAVSVRTTNVVLALPLAEPAITALVRWRRDRGLLPVRVAQSAVMALGGLAGVLPLLFAWRVLYGSWFANPQAYAMSGLPVHFLDVLFARRHGLFFWAPLYVVAAAGMVAVVRGHRALLPAVLMVPALAVVYGYWEQWWLGAAFGMRGFVDLMPVFALGFGAVFAALARWRPARGRVIAWELVVCFALLNFHLATAFRGGAVFVDGPLYWLDTITHQETYKMRLWRDRMAYSDFSEEARNRLIRPDYE